MSEPTFNSDFQGEKQLIQQAERIINTYIVKTKSEGEITQQELKIIKGSPYKALEKFRVDEHDKFFGREYKILELTKYLKNKSVLLLLGASGSGKSSLIQAGVIHKLSDDLGNELVNLIFVPDVNPFKCLYACLISLYGASKADKIMKKEEDNGLIETENSLINVVDELKEADKTWLIFIDQFEELFTSTPKQARDIFIKALNKLIQRQDTTVKIILTMRADFLDKFSPYKELGQIHDQFSLMLTEIEESGVRLAITEPAARNGVIFEEKLVKQIITDFQFEDKHNTGKLPLLQYTLDLLWQKSSLKKEKGEKNRTLTLQTYKDIGRVKGALKTQAKEIYEQFTADEQKIVEQILVELIELTVLEKKEAVVSRRLKKETLERDEKQAKVLKDLIDNRLLVSQGEGKEATVEVAHEELLRSWDVINDLIEEKRELINRRNRLTTDAEQWHKIKRQSPKKAKSELWSGTKLSRIIEFKEEGLLPNLDTVTRDFIKASLQEEKLRQNAKIRTAWTFIGILLAGLLGTGWFALRERQQAQIARTERANAEEQTEIANQKTKEAELNLADSLARQALALWKENDKDLDTLLMAIKAGNLIQKHKTKDLEVNEALASTIFETWEINRLQIHHRNLMSLSFNDDQIMLAFVSKDGNIQLWDVKTGKKFPTLKTDNQNVTSVSFNDDGTILAFGSQDGSIKLWNINTKETKALSNHHNKKVTSISFNDDGTILASGSQDGSIKLWNSNTKETKALSTEHNKPVTSLTFKNNGDVLISKSRYYSKQGISNSIFVYSKIIISDLTSNKSVSIPLTMNGSFNVQNNKIILAKVFGESNIIDFSCFKIINNTSLGHCDGDNITLEDDKNQLVNSLSFNDDGTILASGSQDGTIKLWDIETKKVIRTLTGNNSPVESLSFYRDGKILVSKSRDNTIKIWDASNSKVIRNLDEVSDVSSVSFHPKDKSILASVVYRNVDIHSHISTIKLWNVETGKLIRPFIDANTGVSHKNLVYSVSFNHDGSILASASRDKTIKLWNVKTGELIKSLSDDDGIVYDVSFNHDGSILASASGDKTIKLWNVKTGEIIDTIDDDNPVYIVHFDHNPNSNILAYRSGDNTIKLYDVEKKEVIHTLRGHNQIVYSVSFNQNGTILASGSEDTTIKIWDVNTGKAIHTLRGHNQIVYGVSFNDDGTILASGSEDKTIKLWDVKTGKPIHTLPDHNDFVYGVSFNHDGTILASYEDKTIKLWYRDLDFGLDYLMKAACKKVRGYLLLNPNVSEEDRRINYALCNCY